MISIYKNLTLCELENETRTNTTAAVGGWWYYAWYVLFTL